MADTVFQELAKALDKIDRPGSFCASGSVPVVLPGLEVLGLGAIGLPLSEADAVKLKEHCEQAPYGKGLQTLVDTKVRRVWRLTPKQFTLANPEWGAFVKKTVGAVQEELGLENQKLQSHLYELLLYEPGSFFLPHRDGEKLDRMVATLVIVLPSAFQGGELVVRHEGQVRTLDFGGGKSAFSTHFAAFYADCEHEIRPLKEGHRLCLVYNLTLAKGNKGLTAPRLAEPVDEVVPILRKWANSDEAFRLGFLLDHEYTAKGLAWDALKGVDRVKAQVLMEAAGKADCAAFLVLLTFHEAGSAEPIGGYGRGNYYGNSDDDDSGDYEMGEVFDSDLTAEHFTSADGQPLPIRRIPIDEVELVNADQLKEQKPEEDFEGYTGNAGMTLDRWYRHAAVLIWPNKKHFDVICDAGTDSAVAALAQVVKKWRRSSKTNALPLKEQAVQFATAIMDNWPEQPYDLGRAEDDETAKEWEDDQDDDFEEDEDGELEVGSDVEMGEEVDEEEVEFFPLLAALGEAQLIKSYLAKVLTTDVMTDPGAALTKACAEHGWDVFRMELEGAFKSTTSQSLLRNVRLLERISLAKPKNHGGRLELCQSLATEMVHALERIDAENPQTDYRMKKVNRKGVLEGLAKALLAADLETLLSRVVDHVLTEQKKYSLRQVHIPVLTVLLPWLERNVKKPSRALARWLAACREQLEALTARAPAPPVDFKRDADISCKCADCAKLKRFLENPNESTYRVQAVQHLRGHLEMTINSSAVDLSCKTERTRPCHTLVCTKNTASFEAKLQTFHEDENHLALVRGLEKSLAR